VLTVSTLGSQRSQEVRFVVIGVWNTLFAYGVWASLQFLLGDRLHYLAILVLAWPIAVLNAYICHRRFVFRSSGSIRTELPRFSVVYVLSLVASLIALPILLQVLPLNIYVIQAGFTVVVVVVSYLAHRSFSFGNGSAGSGTTSGRETDDG
jgi:putative flippase GtrA